jgi:integrase
MGERFGTYAGRWLDESVHLRQTTASKYQQHLRTHILPVFGDWYLDQIVPSHVQSWVAAMARSGSSPGTVGTVYRTFSGIMRTAEINRVIGRSPCIGVKLPRDDDPREMTFLDPDQIGRLAAAIDPRYKAMVYVAAYSGCRWGELAYLRTDAVNVLSGGLRRRS